MFRRSNHEFFIKILLSVVLVVLIINIYCLSIIFKDDDPGASTDKIIIKSINGTVFSTSKVLLKAKQNGRKATKKPAVFVHRNTTQLATQKILAVSNLLQKHYKKRFFPSKFTLKFENILKSIQGRDVSAKFLNDVSKWVNGREVFPEFPSNQLGQALNTLCSSRIIFADNAKKGTQLKILVTIEGGFKAIFKPQWYKKDEAIVGEVFAGKDRHNGEVAAFYLSLLLGLHRAPLTVGRKVNLRKEIMSVSTTGLLQTFYQEGNDTCFYGVCYYCKPQDAVCATQDIIEGALILWLPEHLPLKKFRHPWQRTYIPDVPARWELDADYCQVVRKSPLYSRGPRLLDIIDTSIFDFLIDNGDRHHYEVFENISNAAVLLIDNGKR
uniref:FAM20 C-terminal domain-containing protein n=1 Tax=Clastoptera arizonana TaxID=38151 RepID=A0A1B6DK39_9HEMI